MHPYAISEGSEDPLAAAGACYRDSVAVCCGIFPNEMDLLANAMVSFACAMQVQAFRKVNGYAFASTMCIGNLRSGMESLCAYGKTKDKKILRKSGNYFGIIFLFAVGAALGGHMIGYIGARTIWISCIILLISFLCMFIKEEKKEHPEIVQEEREIRENLQNIRKEAKDVEHILEDDIRSQIEKKSNRYWQQSWPPFPSSHSSGSPALRWKSCFPLP